MSFITNFFLLAAELFVVQNYFNKRHIWVILVLLILISNKNVRYSNTLQFKSWYQYAKMTTIRFLDQVVQHLWCFLSVALSRHLAWWWLSLFFPLCLSTYLHQPIRLLHLYLSILWSICFSTSRLHPVNPDVKLLKTLKAVVSRQSSLLINRSSVALRRRSFVFN